MKTSRKAAALIAGFLVVAVLSTLGDVILHATGVFPPWGQPMSNGLFVLATSYRLVFTVLGGYVTARIASAAPERFAVILGIIGTVFALLGVLAWASGGPEMGPLWYPVALVVTALPCCWAGGRLRAGGAMA
ncbi:MAG: hypothetical protein U1E65_16140 [Myxococcota bacterium]